MFCFDLGVCHLGGIRNHSEHSCSISSTPYESSLQIHSSSREEDKTPCQESRDEWWHCTSLRCPLCALPQPSPAHLSWEGHGKNRARWLIQSYSTRLNCCPAMSRVDLLAQWNTILGTGGQLASDREKQNHLTPFYSWHWSVWCLLSKKKMKLLAALFTERICWALQLSNSVYQIPKSVLM